MKANPRTKTSSKESADSDSAQAEFLHDIQVSLQEMQEGKVLPAEDALQLIELGLDDEELESRLLSETGY
ncbi:MAG: hypothetical protein OXI34_10025 [Chloroflexota bacterium]|nr:hypothetical protein [Chloroflexota bacterium]MDE2947527.1 hypothetical protein [Chloroflexota bacterium]